MRIWYRREMYVFDTYLRERRKFKRGKGKANSSRSLHLPPAIGRSLDLNCRKRRAHPGICPSTFCFSTNFGVLREAMLSLNFIKTFSQCELNFRWAFASFDGSIYFILFLRPSFWAFASFLPILEGASPPILLFLLLFFF